MAHVPRAGFCAALALAACQGCSFVSLSDLDAGTDGAGGGGGVATSVNASAASGTSVTATSSGAAGGAGSTGPAGSCVPALFHVDFDDADTTLWTPAVLAIENGSYGDLTDASVRRGAGAWEIALPDGQQDGRLRHNLDYQVGESYWLGVSQEYVTPALGDAGTKLIWGQCAAEPYDQTFGLYMAASTPGQPFSAGVVGDGGSLGPESTLEDVPAVEGFHDWVLHWIPSLEDDGLFEVFHAGVRVYRAAGPNLPTDCPGTIALRMGITRYTQTSTPPQTMVQDEIRLLRGDIPEADALYTLDPDSGCD